MNSGKEQTLLQEMVSIYSRRYNYCILFELSVATNVHINLV
jgi:hypothetical protein